MKTRISVITICLATALCVGCTGPDASFVFSEQTEGLTSEAREGFRADGENYGGVKAAVADAFGNPHNLIAWKRLPIEFGGITGKVATAEAGTETIKVSLDNVSEIEKGSTIAWSGEGVESLPTIIEDFDPETGELKLAAAVSEAPAEGTQFVINPGHVLKSGRGLYMTHCAHCHGTSGDGNGPTAQAALMNPMPRDYRRGIFKFTSTKPADKVTRDDLHRAILRGIPGTYMPSFRLLKDDEVHAIVEYVRWLAMRGEFEKTLNVELEDSFSADAVSARRKDGENIKDIREELRTILREDLAEIVDTAGADLKDMWEMGEDESAMITPSMARTEDSLASRESGRKLFLGKAKCMNCHGEQGLGNGPQTLDYEDDPATGKKRANPGLHDEWGNVVMPRNLTRGIYRGGRRPVDIFRRIHAGIKGAKMPAHNTSLSDAEIWDVVNYVLSIPHGGVSSPIAGAHDEEHDHDDHGSDH